jgi:hypothetical protein
MAQERVELALVEPATVAADLATRPLGWVELGDGARAHDAHGSVRAGRSPARS